MRRIGLGFVLIVFAGIAGALAFAPYLPRLIWEGGPGLTWSDRSHYVDVPGANPPMGLVEAMPSAMPNAALHKLLAEGGGTALLLMRDGRLVLEYYAPGNGPETRFNSFSMVKSLVGALVYKAMAEGRIKNLDQTLGTLLPHIPGLKELTLRRLITMRAGIHFDSRTASFGAAGGAKDSDTFPNPFGPLARLHFEGVASIDAGLTMDEVAPSVLAYQNVSTALLGEVLEVVYGRPLEQLLSEKLWRPAGAATAAWRKPAEGASVSAYCCLFATARDWVRVGAYLSNNGTPTAPFLPEPMWREWFGSGVGLAERRADHYGNHNLQNVLDRQGQDLQGPFTYFMGQNGQILYLMPGKGLVAYRAGTTYQFLHSTLYEAWNSAGLPGN